jgi:hypothetical protein
VVVEGARVVVVSVTVVVVVVVGCVVVVVGIVVVVAANVVVVAIAPQAMLASVQSPLVYSWEAVWITIAYPFHLHMVTAWPEKSKTSELQLPLHIVEPRLQHVVHTFSA